VAAKAKGRFIEPMLLLRTDALPNEGNRWEYRLKFDGYRAIAFKTGGKIHLRSRNDKDFSIRYRLIYAARTRNGFTPVVRQQLFKKFRALEIKDCPFVNLPEAKSGRWGAGLTAAKMKDCRWLKPVLVAQIEFLEWTGEHHLRHTKFMALRDDKPAREVRRE
jgi:ATP-dependent DNA ligase